MKRALLAIAGVGWLLVVTAMGAEEERPGAAARLVGLDVTIAEFHPTLSPAGQTMDGARLLATLRSAEAQEKVFSLSQLQLSTLENQPASMHFGERVAVPAGRTVSSSAAARSANAFQGGSVSYLRENLGTIVGATCRVDEGGLIVIELSVEQSRLAADTEVKLDPADPDASAMLKPQTRTIKTVVSVKDGETVVLGGMIHKSGKQFRQEALLVTARIALTAPVRASGAALPASRGAIQDRVKSYAEQQIEVHDQIGDGVLNAAELSKFERAPPNADRNKDGTVTAEELADAYVNATRRSE